MNTPTKRIFYLFGPKFVKNEPQTKVWGSLTCKSQCSQPVARMFALFALVAHQLRSHAFAAASRLPTRRRGGVLLDAGFLLGALDSSHLLLGKPNGTVIFSVVRCGATKIAQVSASCFQRRHVV